MRKMELKDLQGCRIITAEQDGESIQLQLDNGQEDIRLRIDANTDNYMPMREVIETHKSARLHKQMLELDNIIEQIPPPALFIDIERKKRGQHGNRARL